MVTDTTTRKTFKPNTLSVKNTCRKGSPESSSQSPAAPARFSYPNHYTMKKNRIKKLQQCKGHCEICTKRAKVVHHIDESKDNHSMDNLLALCNQCHRTVHREDKVESIKPTSKYIRLYGATQSSIARRLGLSVNKVYELHYAGKLKDAIDERMHKEGFFEQKRSEVKP